MRLCLQRSTGEPGTHGLRRRMRARKEREGTKPGRRRCRPASREKPPTVLAVMLPKGKMFEYFANWRVGSNVTSPWQFFDGGLRSTFVSAAFSCVNPAISKSGCDIVYPGAPPTLDEKAEFQVLLLRCGCVLVRRIFAGTVTSRLSQLGLTLAV